MESAAKRIKLEEQSSPSPPASEIQFLDLNDDCIFDIFDRLSTRDWCLMSSTCERLQTLALDHFQRKYPDEAITIIKLKAARRTVAYTFSNPNGHPVKLIPNVKMVNVPPSKHLFEFIKAQCCPKLKTLSITTSSIIPAISGEKIKSQLTELESLAVFKLHSKTDIYNGFLKHCPRLEHLTIETTNNWKTNWMLHSYPHLKSLSFLVDCVKPYRGKFGEMAGQFFRNNSQLKDILCIGGWSMNAILLNVSKIECLTIEIKTNDNLSKILDTLKSYCQRSPIDCLEFDITNLQSPVEALNMLNDFNDFHPIHGLSAAFNYNNQNQVLDEEVILNIVGLKQLRDLDISVSGRVMNFYHLMGNFTWLIVQEMVHLEEIKLSSQYSAEEHFLKTFIAPLIRGTVKIKKLTFCGSYRLYSDSYRNMLINSIRIISRDRLLLSGACSMDIQIVTKCGHVQKFIIPSSTKVTK